MKDIKLSFPYPSTSRHNLSQDIATSLSMGLVIPVRVVKVLPGDSHRIGTSYSLVSNPLVKPLLQGVRMRYVRAWIPSRIYSIDLRANNMNYDPLNAPVRVGSFGSGELRFPSLADSVSASNFQQSSLFDYLQIANLESNFIDVSGQPTPNTSPSVLLTGYFNMFNAEPYLGYIDFCRNYFADSATGLIAWSSMGRVPNSDVSLFRRFVCISPLSQLDAYIDNIQNSRDLVIPYNWTLTSYTANSTDSFQPFVLTTGGYLDVSPFYSTNNSSFSTSVFGMSHVGFCVPLNLPDRLSRLFSTKPLTSQSAVVSPSEISISNLSFLAKIQRYLTRKFFGGSRYTDVMYSIFGQKVPHVDTPVVLDVFDQEIGSELVASTNVTDTMNPGVLGGYFASSGQLMSGRGSYKKRYTFNEAGYIMDMVYIMPRIFRSAFYPDFYPVSRSTNSSASLSLYSMSQGNFTPDFNGIGWQQPSFVAGYRYFNTLAGETVTSSGVLSYCSEPSWQQYRTLPDVCSGVFACNRSFPSSVVPFGHTVHTVNVNSPIYVFTDRMDGLNFYKGFKPTDIVQLDVASRYMLCNQLYTDFNKFNNIFGTDVLSVDNFFAVFRYSHQVKSQVSKRFTLTL